MTTKELSDMKSPYSSMRWALVTCIRWGIILGFIAITGFILCALLGKNLDAGFLTGAAAIIGLIIGLPAASKSAQSFAEAKENKLSDYDNNYEQAEEEYSKSEGK